MNGTAQARSYKHMLAGVSASATGSVIVTTQSVFSKMPKCLNCAAEGWACLRPVTSATICDAWPHASTGMLAATTDMHLGSYSRQYTMTLKRKKEKKSVPR